MMMVVVMKMGQIIGVVRAVAARVTPSFAFRALRDEIGIDVVARAHVTLREAKTKRTLGVVVLPFEATRRRLGRAASGAFHAPFAFPVAFGHVIQRRIETVDVVADVAVVAQEQASFVGCLAAALAHRAVQTSPASFVHYVCHLFKQKD